MPPTTPSKLTHRLWLGATALLTLLATLVAGNFVLPADRRLTADMVGHDFLAFYTAGAFVNDGRTADLYRLDHVRDFQHALAREHHLSVGESFGPFWNPPFYALPFAPLAKLPYPQALLAWEGINVACLIAATLLLMRLLRPAGGLAASAASGWRATALIPLLILTSMPLVKALTHGQNTGTSLLLLTLTATFWRANRPILAGLVAGLLFYKPQLAVVVAAALTLTLGWRALAGIAACGVALLILNVLALPGTIHDYQQFMPGNLRQFQVDQPYLWDRHATFRAFWRLLLQGTDPGPMSRAAVALTLASTVALLAGLGHAWLQRTRQRLADATPLIAAAVCAMPLLMPFYFDYDLLLLAVAAVCYVATRLTDAEPHPADRYLTPAWCALYLWQMVNVAVADLTRVNGTVLLLTLVTALLTWRAAGTPAARGAHHPLPNFARASLATNA